MCGICRLCGIYRFDRTIRLFQSFGRPRQAFARFRISPGRGQPHRPPGFQRLDLTYYSSRQRRSGVVARPCWMTHALAQQRPAKDTQEMPKSLGNQGFADQARRSGLDSKPPWESCFAAQHDPRQPVLGWRRNLPVTNPKKSVRIGKSLTKIRPMRNVRKMRIVLTVSGFLRIF